MPRDKNVEAKFRQHARDKAEGQIESGHAHQLGGYALVGAGIAMSGTGAGAIIGTLAAAQGANYIKGGMERVAQGEAREKNSALANLMWRRSQGEAMAPSSIQHEARDAAGRPGGGKTREQYMRADGSAGSQLTPAQQKAYQAKRK